MDRAGQQGDDLGALDICQGVVRHGLQQLLGRGQVLKRQAGMALDLALGLHNQGADRLEWLDTHRVEGSRATHAHQQENEQRQCDIKKTTTAMLWSFYNRLQDNCECWMELLSPQLH